MRTTTMTNSGKSTTGCGCSGGCSRCQGSCATAVPGGGAAALARPRFFAGQLLTEDDLQAMVDYTVAKSRLHNRYLFGAGVACGMHVTCDPCNPRRVIVEPGYALDCCGNDLVVPCPESLDILDLVRRLKAEKGVDCGDPCAPDVASKEPTVSKREREEVDGKARVLERRYCIWIRYAENHADPVAPYVTGADCDTVCEPTRIEESYRFELRCPTDPVPAPDILSTMTACIGDFLSTRATLSRTAMLGVAGNRMQVAAEAIAVAPDNHYVIADPAGFATEVSGLITRTNAAVQKVHANVSMSSHDALAAVEDVAALAAARVRFDMHTEEGKRELGSFDADGVAAALEEATSAFTPSWRANTIDLPLQRYEAAAKIELASEWGMVSSEGSAAREQRLASYEARLLAQGFALSPALYAEYGRALQGVRDGLLTALEGHAATTRCGLLAKLQRIRIPASVAGAEVTPAEVASLSVAIVDVTEVLLEYLLDCFCRALLPSCPPCDDDGVLLACVTVEDCEVTSICNLERTTVLTGPNVRYWLGPLRVVKGLLEKICCELPKTLRPRQDARIKSGPESVTGMKYAYAMKASPITGGDLFAALSDGALEGIDLPDLASTELQQFYGRPGRPIRFDEFKLAATDLFSVVGARAGSTRLPTVKAERVRTTEMGEKLLEALHDPSVEATFDRRVAKSVERAVETGRVDFSETVRRSSERALSAMRAERETAVRGALSKWAQADEGLAAAAAPIIRESVDRHFGVLRERMTEAVTRLAQDQGLDAEAMTRRIRTSIDAKLAEAGLNAPSLTARIEGAISAALSANGLSQRTLNDRLADTVNSRVEALGLDAEALNSRIRNQVDGHVAGLGLAPVALGERIDAEVSRVLARDALTPDALESRLSALVGSRTESFGSELEKSKRAIERKLGKETKALKDEITALRAELKKLGGGGGE